MAQNAPGKAHRETTSVFETADMFPDNETAEARFVKNRWPNGAHCPKCGSTNVQTDTPSKTQPYRCRERQCRVRFSTSTGTVMHGSKLPYRTWAIAVYLCMTSLKGVSSMKLHCDLKITQKSACHLAMRIRQALDDGTANFPLAGPVEVGETYVGGKRKNMSKAKRKKLKAEGTGRGTVGKTAIVGPKDRETNKVKAAVIQSTDAPTLQGFAEGVTASDATAYTDEAKAYKGMDRDHEAVKHSI